MKRKVKIVGLCTLVWISGAFYLLQNNKHEVSVRPIKPWKRKHRREYRNTETHVWSVGSCEAIRPVYKCMFKLLWSWHFHRAPIVLIKQFKLPAIDGFVNEGNFVRRWKWPAWSLNSDLGLIVWDKCSSIWCQLFYGPNFLTKPSFLSDHFLPSALKGFQMKVLSLRKLR